jgi:hypothetical protein
LLSTASRPNVLSTPPAKPLMQSNKQQQAQSNGSVKERSPPQTTRKGLFLIARDASSQDLILTP